MTEKGTCDRAYRYPVRISNGSVGYAGEASFNVSGSVGANGAVTVTVSKGSQSAKGTGQLVRQRRLRPLDRRLRRMLRLLDRRAPLLRFLFHDDSATSKLKARLAPGFFLRARRISDWQVD